VNILMSHTVVTPLSDVVCTELQNGEAVLLHLDTQKYYSLNETGLRIWHLAGQGLTVEEISQALEAQYEVSLDRAQQSVTNLVTSLAAENLVALSNS
jgi:hypothetical protein